MKFGRPCRRITRTYSLILWIILVNKSGLKITLGLIQHCGEISLEDLDNCVNSVQEWERRPGGKLPFGRHISTL